MMSIPMTSLLRLSLVDHVGPVATRRGTAAVVEGACQRRLTLTDVVDDHNDAGITSRNTIILARGELRRAWLQGPPNGAL